MMWLFLIVPMILIAAAAYAAPNASGGSVSSARRVLDERLAAGDLTIEEHTTRVAALAERTDVRLSRPAIIFGLVVLLLATFLMWGAAGMMGSGWWDGGGMMDGDGMMGDHMGRTRSGTAGAPISGATVVEIAATDLRFEPVTVSSTVGEPVNITLINDGEVFHDLAIDELGFRLAAPPGSRVTGSLSVDEPGTYDFLCTVAGHAAAGMRGTVEVSSAG